jgi:ArsR family transcriptional regulator
MDEKQAVASLAALAHPQRLQIFRRLVREGPSGLAAFEIAEAVKASPTAASFHLKELDRAGLIHATRHGRFVRYAVHIDGMRRLLTYLTEDCCQGQPELCGSSVGKARSLCKTEASKPQVSKTQARKMQMSRAKGG